MKISVYHKVDLRWRVLSYVGKRNLFRWSDSSVAKSLEFIGEWHSDKKLLSLVLGSWENITFDLHLPVYPNSRIFKKFNPKSAIISSKCSTFFFSSISCNIKLKILGGYFLYLSNNFQKLGRILRRSNFWVWWIHQELPLCFVISHEFEI